MSSDLEAPDRRRVWFVTGASSGFGRALSEAVLEHGDRLTATARAAATTALSSLLLTSCPLRMATLRPQLNGTMIYMTTAKRKTHRDPFGPGDCQRGFLEMLRRTVSQCHEIP